MTMTNGDGDDDEKDRTCTIIEVAFTAVSTHCCNTPCAHPHCTA